MKRPIAAYALIALGFASGVASITFMNGGTRPPLAAATPQKLVPAEHTMTENLNGIRDIDGAFANISEYATPSVVHIRSINSGKADSEGRRMPLMEGDGAGFVYRKDGYILTNDHVAGGYDKVTVIFSDGRELDGKVIRGSDSDIAVVKVNASNLTPLPLADSSKIRPGQFAIAFGTPFGLENSVSVGHVSAIGRMNSVPDPNEPNGGRLYPDLIQTDAAINRGNSGGPLVNIEGQVIGINTAIFTTNGASNGVGFAIPSNQVRLIADILIRDGKLTRSRIGVAPSNLKEYIRKERGIKGGAVVEELPPDGPAAKAGIVKGDIIVKIGDQEVTSQIDLRNSMLKFRPGTTVNVDVLRGKDRKNFSVKLEEASSTPPAKAPTENPSRDRIKDLEDMPDIREFFNKMPKLKRNGGQEDDETVPPIGRGQIRLGVTLADLTDEMRKTYFVPQDAKGALILNVETGSVAESIGIRSGDVIQGFGGKTIQNKNELIAEVGKCKVGDEKKVTLSRFSSKSTTRIEVNAKFK